MRAKFLTSAVEETGWPKADRPEIAIVGRSNVGKSSLLNALVRESVARTSKSPGRTQLLNFFDVEDGRLRFRFADLPGYGFAKAPKTVRSTWPRMVHSYLTRRPTLRALLLLVDVRHDVQPSDFEAVSWLRSHSSPIRLVLVGTKADKVAKSRRGPAILSAADALGLVRPDVLLTSASSGLGLDALRDSIRALVRDEVAGVEGGSAHRPS